MAGIMMDSMPSRVVRRLSHYGKVLFYGGVAGGLLYYMPAGREAQRVTRHSRSLRTSELGSLSGAEVQPYITPEGIFNPELPRDRRLDVVLSYFKGGVSNWDRHRAVLQEHQPFWVMYRY
jgi:hypothetical protein